MRTARNLARKAEASLYLHAIHLAEVYYITLREEGQKSADLAYARIKAFPLTYIDRIDERLLLKAASLKARYPISYADSFAAALSKIYNCALLTGDPALGILEKENLVIQKDQVNW